MSETDPHKIGAQPAWITCAWIANSTFGFELWEINTAALISAMRLNRGWEILGSEARHTARVAPHDDDQSWVTDQAAIHFATL